MSWNTKERRVGVPGRGCFGSTCVRVVEVGANLEIFVKHTEYIN